MRSVLSLWACWLLDYRNARQPRSISNFSARFMRSELTVFHSLLPLPQRPRKEHCFDCFPLCGGHTRRRQKFTLILYVARRVSWTKRRS